MSSKHALLKFARLLHLYLGVFATPALLFFAITGALQTFSLHETTRGSDYKPPKIIAELAQLHKKQTLVVPEKKSQPPTPAKQAADKPDNDKPVGDKPAHDKHVAEDSTHQAPSAPGPEAKPKNLLPMKIFFLIIAISLLLSTITGLYMSYKFVRNKTLVTASLLAGIIIPVLLTLL